MSSSAGEASGSLVDVKVIELARRSAGEALELLYAAHKIRIYTFLLRFLGDPDAADDVTQETFTKAYAALPRLSSEHKLLPWLYRIATNAAIDHTRRRRRRTWLRLGRLEGTGEEPAARDDHVTVDEREELAAALRRLPPENAAALLLHVLEGYSYREIAEIQGCSMTAVRSRISRAREALRLTATIDRGPAS